ncbi:hypothetical protein GJV06_00845 [Enterobacteriaceae bacterium RIT691]|nr:hypothetical protein [Enterobacteriaceae bacterium RIT691]
MFAKSVSSPEWHHFMPQESLLSRILAASSRPPQTHCRSKKTDKQLTERHGSEESRSSVLTMSANEGCTRIIGGHESAAGESAGVRQAAGNDIPGIAAGEAINAR